MFCEQNVLVFRVHYCFTCMLCVVLVCEGPAIFVDNNVQAVASLADEDIVAAVTQADSSIGDEDHPDEEAATRSYPHISLADSMCLVSQQWTQPRTFFCDATIKPSLTPSYEGPFRVFSPSEKTLKIDAHGKADSVVRIPEH